MAETTVQCCDFGRSITPCFDLSSNEFEAKGSDDAPWGSIVAHKLPFKQQKRQPVFTAAPSSTLILSFLHICKQGRWTRENGTIRYTHKIHTHTHPCASIFLRPYLIKINYPPVSNLKLNPILGSALKPYLDPQTALWSGEGRPKCHSRPKNVLTLVVKYIFWYSICSTYRNTHRASFLLCFS